MLRGPGGTGEDGGCHDGLTGPGAVELGPEPRLGLRAPRPAQAPSSAPRPAPLSLDPRR